MAYIIHYFGAKVKGESAAGILTTDGGDGINSEPNKKLRLTPPLASREAGMERGLSRKETRITGGGLRPPRPREGWTGLDANDKMPASETSLDGVPLRWLGGAFGDGVGLTV